MRYITTNITVFLLMAACQISAAEVRLVDFAEKADWGTVRSLLKQSVGPNSAQVDGMTALHWAVHHDDLEAVNQLIAVGANVKAANRYGVTPLALACENGNESIVSALLAKGAELGSRLRGGETVLMIAARTGRVGPVRALLDAKADVNATDQRGQSALMWAAADGHDDVIQQLIEAGADINAKLTSGFTALMFAAREGRIGAARLLLKAGVPVNETIMADKANGKSPRKGTSALVIAVENGHFEFAVELVNAGADPNDQRSGYTPLHNLTWVRKPNRGDGDDGQPPPDGSGRLNSLDFARELVRLGADVNARIEKGSSGRGKLSTTGATPFLMAAKTADLSYLQVLVELGADPRLTNQDQCTPLMAAAGIGTQAPSEEAGSEPEAIEVVEYLLAMGAEINAVDLNGETAMHGAAYKSLPKMVRLLTDKGANVRHWNKANKYGWTPLLIAEGHRPGNFKPSAETMQALYRSMRSAGIVPPNPTPRPEPTKKGYDAN